MTDSAELPSGVSESPEAEMATQPTAQAAEPGDRAVLWLNDRWRIAHDGKLQWILQRSKVSKSTGDRRWSGRRFYVERDALLRSIRELCGEVGRVAVPVIATWPGMYRPDFAGGRFPVRGHEATAPSRQPGTQAAE